MKYWELKWVCNEWGLTVSRNYYSNMYSITHATSTCKTSFKLSVESVESLTPEELETLIVSFLTSEVL